SPRRPKPPKSCRREGMVRRLRSRHVRRTANQICPRPHRKPPQRRSLTARQEKTPRFGRLTPAASIGWLQFFSPLSCWWVLRSGMECAVSFHIGGTNAQRGSKYRGDARRRDGDVRGALTSSAIARGPNVGAGAL